MRVASGTSWATARAAAGTLGRRGLSEDEEVERGSFTEVGDDWINEVDVGFDVLNMQ